MWLSDIQVVVGDLRCRLSIGDISCDIVRFKEQSLFFEGGGTYLGIHGDEAFEQNYVLRRKVWLKRFILFIECLPKLITQLMGIFD